MYNKEQFGVGIQGLEGYRNMRNGHNCTGYGILEDGAV
jgi:hypothetical protein